MNPDQEININIALKEEQPSLCQREIWNYNYLVTKKKKKL